MPAAGRTSGLVVSGAGGDVLARVEALEAANRRLRLAFAALAAAALLAVPAAGYALRPAGKAPPADVVARSISLRTPDGRTRGLWTVGDDGVSRLEVIGAGGGVVLSAGRDGSTYVGRVDGRGDPVAR